MSDSLSLTKPYPDPPSAADGPDTWGRWAVEFLDRLCREWNEWQGTWTYHDDPIIKKGDPNAYCILDRDSRRVGTSRRIETGRPPPGILQAAPLLDKCSDAVLRFSDQSAWRFADQEQANEVADALLKGAQLIRSHRYHEFPQEMLQELSRLVRMATRRPKRSVEANSTEPASGSVEPRVDQDLEAKIKPSRARPKSAGGRPSVPAHEDRKREELVKRWRRAKAEGVRQKDFCCDNDVRLEYLTKCVNWLAQRRRRNNNQ